MREEWGELVGDVTLDADVWLFGTATGNVVVPPGRHLELTGIIRGNVEVKPGGSASIRGIVIGGVANEGHVELWGIVRGGLHNAEGADSVSHRAAQPQDPARTDKG